MAAPRRPAAMASDTSLASVMAVKNFKMEVTCPYDCRDAAHVWVRDLANEKLVEVQGELHVLTPLKKVYTDPLGLRDLIPPEPKAEDCPLCTNILVSQNCKGTSATK